MTPRGIFSPIEDVVAEAERRAVVEWEREHQPCPHDVTYLVMCQRDPICMYCGATVPDEV
jgi:hypothetical protein